ncbi:hypothetical protein ACVWZ3_009956 [Bradyrhizobium sp. i1.3.6]
MALFSTYSLQKPGNFNLWNRAHKFSGDNKVKLTVQKRIRKPVSETAAGAWATLNEVASESTDNARDLACSRQHAVR